MRAKFDETLSKIGLMVIDGSMSTMLEQLGCKMNDKLWTARVLADQPELIKQVHTNYFNAGADCGITCSYQATIPGFVSCGYTEAQAEELIIKSVKLFLEAREQWWKSEDRAADRIWPLCLAGIGPYGAYLADGSEFSGGYGISDKDLREFHFRRAELLHNAGADILLFETQPSLREVLVEAEIAEELGAEYWISFSCCDDKHINEGDNIAECAKRLSEGYPHLKAIGVNCSKPEYIVSLIRELRSATNLPIVVYPNSGEQYDPIKKVWHGRKDSKTFYDYALDYYRAGASAVGGCCTTLEKHIQQVAAARKSILEKQ